MEFKQANHKDAASILAIIKEAQNYLKDRGIDQWQNNYPNTASISNDINQHNAYVLLKDNLIVGTVAAILGPDQTYKAIYDGEWLTSGAYGVIHRMAVNPKYHGLGLASMMIQQVEKMWKDKGISSIRIDTHTQNSGMQRLLAKNGFEYCGIIYLEDGNKRIAFEKILKG